MLDAVLERSGSDRREERAMSLSLSDESESMAACMILMSPVGRHAAMLSLSLPSHSGTDKTHVGRGKQNRGTEILVIQVEMC